MLTLNDIALLLAHSGASQYGGEPVTQLAVRDAVTPHVDATRFLCRANAGYFARLSAAANTTHA